MEHIASILGGKYTTFLQNCADDETDGLPKLQYLHHVSEDVFEKMQKSKNFLIVVVMDSIGRCFLQFDGNQHTLPTMYDTPIPFRLQTKSLPAPIMHIQVTLCCKKSAHSVCGVVTLLMSKKEHYLYLHVLGGHFMQVDDTVMQTVSKKVHRDILSYIHQYLFCKDICTNAHNTLPIYSAGLFKTETN